MEVRYCSSCGQSISANARFCTSCGNPIEQEAYQEQDSQQQVYQQQAQQQQQQQQQQAYQQQANLPQVQTYQEQLYQQQAYQQPGYQQQQQAYQQQGYQQQAYQQQAYQTPTWQNQQSNPYNTPEAEWLWLYSHSDQYVEKWIKKSNWNWASFLFFPFWAGYRKMYAESAIYVAIFVGMAFIEQLLDFSLPFARIGMYILCGTLGNKLYFNKAQKDIDHILSLHADHELRRSFIYQKGGTSGWGIVYGIGMILIGMALLAIFG
ncbi:DUF2628 domain-containing protein [Paenibacillus sp. D2_2]|uniref:DUF2628 domain-containing protein n=1 Tax=Paenibacillus sp. D2_2 TaxID=3073092 RepID=UPI002814F55A|nr:DUF2628 domain-containing protein [Paenibacillus sp. D2_2]WMT41972.1 DUF2628 domain-containing protein [Paenibacillus sp. D2_2]